MDDVAVRGAVIAALLLALCGLLVLGGAGVPTQPGKTPSAETLDRNYAAHVGGTVEIGGTVVATDPLVVAVEYDTGVYGEATYRLTVAGDLLADVGDSVVLYGELRPDRTVAVDADRSVVREPWELAYMYGVSVVGLLLVGARFLNGWRVRPRRLRVAPRDRTLVERWRGDGDA